MRLSRIILIALAIALFTGLLAVFSGCSSNAPMIQYNAPQSASACGDSEVSCLQSAEARRKNFFYTGECNEQCEKVIEAYNKAAEYSESAGDRAEALKQLSEFLYWLRDYEAGLGAARKLAESAPTGSYNCTALILIAQNLRQMNNTEASFDYFSSALQICEDRQDFVRQNICSIYHESGRIDKAKELCPAIYS